MRVLITFLLSLVVFIAGCSEAPSSRTVVTPTCPDGATAPGLSGLSLHDPAEEDRRAAMLDCLIFIADQTWAQAPLEYGGAHFRWHAFAVLDERRTAESLVEPAGVLYWSEAQDAVRWLAMVMGKPAWRAEDAYDCPLAPARLTPALEAARPDWLSRMCENLARLRPDPHDAEAMIAVVPFTGQCPSSESFGLRTLQLLPARLAVKADGDLTAFICLLDEARLAVDHRTIPLPGQLAVFIAARRLGLLDPAEWERVTAMVEAGVDDEDLEYWFEEARTIAATEYAALE